MSNLRCMLNGKLFCLQKVIFFSHVVPLPVTQSLACKAWHGGTSYGQAMLPGEIWTNKPVVTYGFRALGSMWRVSCWSNVADCNMWWESGDIRGAQGGDAGKDGRRPVVLEGSLAEPQESPVCCWTPFSLFVLKRWGRDWRSPSVPHLPPGCPLPTSYPSSGEAACGPHVTRVFFLGVDVPEMGQGELLPLPMPAHLPWSGLIQTLHRLPSSRCSHRGWVGKRYLPSEDNLENLNTKLHAFFRRAIHHSIMLKVTWKQHAS